MSFPRQDRKSAPTAAEPVCSTQQHVVICHEQRGHLMLLGHKPTLICGLTRPVLQHIKTLGIKGALAHQ